MIKKIRLIEPGNYSPYKKSILNFFTYNKYIKNPSTGLMTLTTIVKKMVDDTLMYSESISEIVMDDIVDSDIIFFSINTFNAARGYYLAQKIREKSRALLVFGGMHASLNYSETIKYCDCILTGDADESIIDLIQALNDNQEIDFAGVVYKLNGSVIYTGKREPPENIDTIPDRNLLYHYSRSAKRYDTLWPQVHASRGCPHHCSYCSIIQHFGRKIRKRSPENVVQDIKDAIEFHRRKILPRLNTGLWITDDNFAQDRDWAKSVLNEMIRNNIRYHFTVQARFEIGFDDEILTLMKKAGFFEVAIGIEFLEDDTFKQYNKQSKYSEIVQSIKNIRKHGIGVRGLFIVGAENDTKGIGAKIAQFVSDHKIHGALVQSLFFTPGTPFYENHKDILFHEDWDKYDGNVVHYPKNMKPYELQEEIIDASRRIYSINRLIHAVLTFQWFNKIVFIGEFFWHISLRKQLKKELAYLKTLRDRPERH